MLTTAPSYVTPDLTFVTRNDIDYLDAADLFCGAGGTSTGLLQAASDLHLNLNLVAINHWDLAISTHSQNHPGVTHYNSDLNDVDPRAVVPGGKLRLLVASPECTHFSKARGGKPMNKQSRASIKYVLRWVRALDVEDVLIENVPEFLDFGPLDPKTMTPVDARKGEYFYRFVRKLEEFGYQVSWRLMVAADYGDPTTRKRLFIQARKTRPIRWPDQTHHKNGGDMFGPKQQWRAAREIIDFTLPNESIFGRKKSLSPNTLRRIEAGLKKYCGASFIITTNWGETNRSQPKSLDDPLPTITGQNFIGLAQPFIIPLNHGKGDIRVHDLGKPMPTITSVDAWALVEPFLIEYHGSTAAGRERTRSLNEPLPTIDCSNRFGLVEPFMVEYYGTGNTTAISEPLPTITGRDRFALVQPFTIEQDGKLYLVDIRFRMLQPSELARGMGFPDNYHFSGTREQVVKQIGNSVPVNLATQLCKALLEDK
jgi:DNA (cytosine-5)-methyltransferase 1